MNSSVRTKLPPGIIENGESRADKLKRIQAQVKDGFYASREVMRDVADALLMNPAPFEALNEKEEGQGGG